MLSARLPNLQLFLRAVPQAEAIFTRELSRAVFAGARLIRDEARRQVKRDTGRLMGSIRANRPVLEGDTIRGGVTVGQPYGLAVERGRGAGLAPPPARPIAQWASRHGIAPTPRAVFRLQRAIGRRGIAPAPFLAPAYEELRPTVEALISEANARALRAVFSGDVATSSSAGEGEA